MKQTLVFSFLFLISCANNIKSEKFDSEKWKNGTQIERGKMATDLIKSKILIGKTKPETIEYLGFPKDSSKTMYHYIVDLGYMIPFHLDVIFEVNENKVNRVTLRD